MKVLIAGGSGLLGQKLAKALDKAGHEVTILSRNPELLKWHVYGVHYSAWDSSQPDQLSELVEGQDVIINLAGANIAGENLLQMRWTAGRRAAIMESRLQSGTALSQALKKTSQKPKVFLQASAIGYYGPRDDEALDEQAPAGNDFLADVCRQWEQASKSVEKVGVRHIVLRTGLVFGAGARILSLLMLPFHILAGGPVGNGRQFMSWIHAQDWVRAVQFLMEHQSARGAFNLVAPNPVSNRSFAKTLGQVMRRPSLLPTPAFALKLALGSASTLALDGQRVIPAALNKLGFRFEFPELRLALRNILNTNKVFARQFLVRAEPRAVIDYHRNTQILKRLTPLPIIVQFQRVEPVSEGSRALFTLWFGPIPVKWDARHHNLLPEAGFTDTQDSGPFKSWVHDHRFFRFSTEQTAVQDYIRFQYGETGFSWLISRFMGLTLPILFAYRLWRTKRDLEQISYP